MPRQPRFYLALAAALLFPILAGCSHTITLLGEDCPGPGGWCPVTRDVAAHTWQYAQLSQNAYWEQAQDSDEYIDQLYVLPGDLKERFASANDSTGFAYSLFDRFKDGRLVEVILVYRGTEGLRDWIFGNILGRQAPRGMTIYRQVREGLDKAGYTDVPLTLAGHSLGGRIADHVMKRLVRENGALPPNLSSYMFNPNAGGAQLKEEGDWQGAVHVSVSESGDIAGWVRALSNDPQWDGYVIDCRKSMSPIANHHMRQLADCLTWVAALDSAAAKKSVERNELPQPQSEQQLAAQGAAGQGAVDGNKQETDEPEPLTAGA